MESDRLTVRSKRYQLCLALFDGMLLTLGEMYEAMRTREFRDPKVQLQWAVLTTMAAFGIRHLRAARSLIDGYWMPEAMCHVRPATDAALDMAYLLSSGKDRNSRAVLYRDIGNYRVPYLVFSTSGREKKAFDEEEKRNIARSLNMLDGYEESRERLMETALEACCELVDCDSGTRNRDPRIRRTLNYVCHWSGEDGERVKKQAAEYLKKEKLTDFDIVSSEGGEDIWLALRAMLAGIPSAILHCDPATASFMPIKDGGIDLEPSPGHGGLIIYPLINSALLLVGCMAKRLGGSWNERRDNQIDAYNAVGQALFSSEAAAD